MPSTRGIDRLTEQGVRLKDRLGEQRVLCPRCKGGSGKEKSLAVNVRPDSVIWICHRGTCGWTGAAFDETNTGSHSLRGKSRDQRADPYANARRRWARPV